MTTLFISKPDRYPERDFKGIYKEYWGLYLYPNHVSKLCIHNLDI